MSNYHSEGTIEAKTETCFSFCHTQKKAFLLCRWWIRTVFYYHLCFSSALTENIKSCWPAVDCDQTSIGDNNPAGFIRASNHFQVTTDNQHSCSPADSISHRVADGIWYL